MQKKQQHQPVYPVWQVFTSILVGLATGIVLLVVLSRSHCQALSQVLTPSAFGIQLSPGSAGLSGLAPALNEHMNLLVMGVDSNGRGTQRYVGTRSDMMMIVSLDPARKRVGLVSIPRDSRVAIEGHGTDKINSAYAFGGPDLAVATVRKTFLVQIDHYVVLDTEGLKTLVQALGPVQVVVEKAMHYRDRSAGLNIDLQPGVNSLDAAQAEEYVRFRHDALGDIGRVERQQWFLRQLASKLKEPQIILKLPALIGFARDNVVTDLTAQDMFKLVSFLKDVQPTQMETATLRGVPAMIGGGSYWLVDMDQARVTLQRLVGTGLLAVSPAEQENGTATARVPKEGSVVSPVTVAIKYPRGAEETAARIESLLNNSGYRVGCKWQTQLSDCRHEQITQSSERADDPQTDDLRRKLPELATWPIVLSMEANPAADFVLVIPASRIKGTIPGALTSSVGRNLVSGAVQ